MPVDVRRAAPERGAVLIAALALTATAQAAESTEPASSAAAAPSVTLEWSGPGPEDNCLGRDRLENAVDDYLGRPAFSVPPADTTLQVRIKSRGEQGYRALITLRETATGRVLGERELVSKLQLCSGLDEALELTVALMVDSDWAGAAEPSPAPEESPSSPVETPEAPAPKSRRPWQFGIEGVALAGFGALPHPGAGAEVALTAAPIPWFMMRLHGRGFLPSSASAGSAEVEMTLLAAGLALCPRAVPDSSWAVAVCAGFESGLLLSAPSGLEGGHDETRGWFGGSFGARAELRLSQRFGLLGEGFAIVPIRPERYVIDLDDEREVVFQMDSPFWVVGLGFTASF
jgi:hypothetical protein